MHIIRDGSDQAAAVLILAHGAGAGSDSEFMEWFAHSLTNSELAAGLVVCRFDFLYMLARRLTGIKRPPDRAASHRNVASGNQFNSPILGTLPSAFYRWKIDGGTHR